MKTELVPVIDKWAGTDVRCPSCSYRMTLSEADRGKIIQEGSGYVEYAVTCPRGGEEFAVRERSAS